MVAKNLYLQPGTPIQPEVSGHPFQLYISLLYLANELISYIHSFSFTYQPTGIP